MSLKQGPSIKSGNHSKKASVSGTPRVAVKNPSTVDQKSDAPEDSDRNKQKPTVKPRYEPISDAIRASLQSL